jgi:hypothetical protein
MRREDGMNTVHGALLGLAIAFGGMASSAQEVKVPFRQIELEAQVSAHIGAPAGQSPINRTTEPASAVSSLSGDVLPVPVYKRERTMSASYFLWNGLHLGMASLDVAMTQHCIANRHCREGNPIMPSSLSGQLSIDFSLVSYGAFIGYEVKKRGSKIWWLPSAVGAAAHAAGAATGFVNR